MSTKNTLQQQKKSRKKQAANFNDVPFYEFLNEDCENLWIKDQEKENKWYIRQGVVKILQNYVEEKRAVQIEQFLFDRLFIFHVEEYTYHVRELVFFFEKYPQCCALSPEILSSENFFKNKDYLNYISNKTNQLQFIESNNNNNINVMMMDQKNFFGKPAYISCKFCKKNTVIFDTAQLRSADESETVMYSCMADGCKKKWKE